MSLGAMISRLRATKSSRPPDSPVVAASTGGRSELTTVAIVGIGVGLVLATFAVYAQLTASHFIGDAYYYLSAGERLNAGHPLYSLSPGDRLVAIEAPFWTVPSVSPPFLGVVWRPLAALPRDLGADLWWLASLSALGASIVFVVSKRPILGGLALAALCIPIAMEAGLGNVNGFLLAGALAAWRWRDRTWAGVIVGLMISVKVWPFALAVWLAGQARWRALVATVVTVGACGLVGIVGGGWDNTVAYLTVGKAVHPSAFSLTWLLGLPWLWAACLIVGLAATIALRGRPDWSFRVALLTMVLGNPVANPNTYALLLALLVTPQRRRTVPVSGHAQTQLETAVQAAGVAEAKPG